MDVKRLDKGKEVAHTVTGQSFPQTGSETLMWDNGTNAPR